MRTKQAIKLPENIFKQFVDNKNKETRHFSDDDDETYVMQVDAKQPLIPPIKLPDFTPFFKEYVDKKKRKLNVCLIMICQKLKRSAYADIRQ